MPTLGNRNKDDPTGEYTQTLDEVGYTFDRFERIADGFVAHAHVDMPSGLPAPASAMGRTQADAARALVATIKRP